VLLAGLGLLLGGHFRKVEQLADLKKNRVESTSRKTKN
jgi:hypothetical protein